MSEILLFDRALKRRQLKRAAAKIAQADYLFQEAADRLLDRLDGLNRPLDRVLEIGARGSFLASRLAGRKLSQAASFPLPGCDLVCDEEYLPIGDTKFQLVLSLLGLHWVNDLPGALVQIRKALAEDGLFLASLFGANTLKELRAAQVAAESRLRGGISPRISPFTDAREMAGLLQRAGFALPVADTETITVLYPDALTLMRDLQAMGETNALLKRPKRNMGKALLFAIAEEYQKQFGTEEGIPATFEIITITGWAN